MGAGTPQLDTQAQYINVLVGPIVLILITALVAYYQFHDDFVGAIYFSVITMTTVGYGDMVPETWSSKLFMIVLMPTATAALTFAVSESGKIATRDAIRKAKF